MCRAICLALLVATMLAAVGCQGRPTLGQGCPTGLITGTLVEDEGTLSIEVSPGRTQQVLWPDGVTVSQAESGLALIGFFGQVIARQGDVIEMGGGYTTGDALFISCGEIKLTAQGS